MSKSYITSIEALPAEAREFVNFLKEIVTNENKFIDAFLPELEDYRLGNANKYYGYENNEKETYLMDLLNASDTLSSGCDIENHYNKMITDFLLDYAGTGFRGEYRLTMVFDAYDYVIKFPIQEIDACLIESNNYALAKEENLSNFFAPAYNLGPLDFFEDKGYFGNIYIQKKVGEVVENVNIDGIIDFDFWECGPVDGDAHFFEENEYFSTEEAEEFLFFLDDFDIDMFRYAGIVFFLWLNTPETEMHRLNDFLFEHHINDLHTNNVGFLNGDYHKAPVILDYAGYLG